MLRVRRHPASTLIALFRFVYVAFSLRRLEPALTIP